MIAHNQEQVPVNIQIAYCVECSMAPLATKLAKAIEQRFGLEPELVEAHGGVYRITVNGDVVYDNLERGGLLPSDTDVFAAIAEYVEPLEPTQPATEKGISGGPAKIRVFNPIGYPPKITPVKMASRPETLEGKTIYLVDCRFDDSDLLLDQMANWFAEHMPSVTTVRRSKIGTHTQDDPELWAEIKEKGDAAVIGVGH